MDTVPLKINWLEIICAMFLSLIMGSAPFAFDSAKHFEYEQEVITVNSVTNVSNVTLYEGSISSNATVTLTTKPEQSYCLFDEMYE